MRWADLVLAYVRVMIWPVVVVSLLFFNRHVRTILSRLADRIKDLRSFQGFGTKLDFDPGQRLLEARKEVDKASAPAEPTPEPGQAPRTQPDMTARAFPTPDSLADSAQNSPQTTIVAAWQELEATVALLHRKLKLEALPITGTVSQTAAICSELTEKGVLDGVKLDAVLTAATNLAYLRPC